MAESKRSSKISVIPTSDFARWDKFVSTSPQGSFFHTSRWANIIKTAFHRDYEIVCYIKNGQIVGGMIFFYHHKLFWNVITPTPLFPFTSPLFYRPADEKRQKTTHNQLTITSQFIIYLREHYRYWVLDTPAHSIDMRAFQWQGASVEPHYTYKVVLKNIDDLLLNFSQTVRKKIKQAESMNCTVYEERTPDILVDLVNSSYSRHGIKPLIKTNALRSVLENALDLEQVKLYTAKINGKIKAARLIVVDQNTIYDLLAGSDDPSGVGSTFLVSYILKTYLKSHNYFDFMGANHPEIEIFKRGYGGELVQGFRISNKVKIPLSWLVRFRQYQFQKKRRL